MEEDGENSLFLLQAPYSVWCVTIFAFAFILDLTLHNISLCLNFCPCSLRAFLIVNQA